MRKLIGVVLVLMQMVAMASPGGVVEGRNNPISAFDVDNANERYERIVNRLNVNTMELVEVKQAVVRLNEVVDEAQQCVNQTDNKIQQIDRQIKQYFGDKPGKEKGADLNYLEEQKEKYTKHQAKCRLLMIKAKDNLDLWRETIVSQQQKITFTKGKSIWQRGMQLSDDFAKYQWPAIKETITTVDKGLLGLTSVLMLLPVLLLSWCIAGKLHHSSRPRQRLTWRITVILYPLLLLIIGLYYGSGLFIDEELGRQVSASIVKIMFVLGGILLVTMMFSVKRFSEILKWYGLNARFLYRLIATIALLYIVNIVGNAMLTLMNAPANSIYFFESIMLLLVLWVLFYLTLRFYSVHRLFFGLWLSKTLLIEVFVTVIIALIIADAVGYHLLAMNISKVLITLLVTASLGIIGWRGIQKVYLLMHYSPQSALYIRKVLGYRTEPPYYEMVIVKWIFQLVLLLLILYLFSLLMGEQGYVVDGLLEYFSEGFQFAAYRIIPMQWMMGLLIFCLLVIVARYVAAQVSKQEQFEEQEEEIQVAFASIINYVGLAIAVIFGLLIAGFSFTSLAIIAGALSVGIGLGLQSIVTNFFSGLILLIEKPIKAGDRISVNGVEGFVKRVRVRSTQIMTPAKEDIIIPNSDLISQQVTNYMYSDNLWRVKCEVGVAYGSDVRLVEKVLRDVASAHPEVVQDEKNQPLVFFCSFGDSALLFELWCLITDVNNKYRVSSELNFAIDKAFRENKISIAFPQQDVHIHFPDSEPPL